MMLRIPDFETVHYSGITGTLGHTGMWSRAFRERDVQTQVTLIRAHLERKTRKTDRTPENVRIFAE